MPHLAMAKRSIQGIARDSAGVAHVEGVGRFQQRVSGAAEEAACGQDGDTWSEQPYAITVERILRTHQARPLEGKP